jgi:hypothetical protein
MTEANNRFNPQPVLIAAVMMGAQAEKICESRRAASLVVLHGHCTEFFIVNHFI